ncbi:MAG: hypothetical protein AAFY59_14090, partial [Pseudomonadota bacterium]
MHFHNQKRFLLPSRSLLKVKKPHVFVHTRRQVRETVAADKLDFFRLLGGLARARGFDCHLVRNASYNHRDLPSSHHLNVVMGGPPMLARNVMHACPSYIHGFWYFDELGERESSSLRLRTFRPGMIAADRARAFADTVRERILGEGRTKWPQPEEGATPLERDAIVIFGQELREGTRQLIYLPTEPLVRTVIEEAAGRTVYIKPHPRQRPDQLAHLRSFHAPERGVHVVDANLFDLLDAAAFTVSVGSAACFEGFLFGKPAILTSRTDFHQNALTARSVTELRGHLARIEEVQFAHDKFLTWFLRDGCIDPRTPHARDRIDARIVEKGFWPPREEAATERQAAAR